MNLETYIRAQMVRFAIEEGQRHGGVNNMLAILHVLRNRVFAGWGNWGEVVKTAPEKRGTLYPPTATNEQANDVRVLLNRVDEIYSRADTTDLTGGALLYCDQGLPLQEWFVKEVLSRSADHPRSAHIGPVWFFK